MIVLCILLVLINILFSISFSYFLYLKIKEMNNIKQITLDENLSRYKIILELIDIIFENAYSDTYFTSINKYIFTERRIGQTEIKNLFVQFVDTFKKFSTEEQLNVIHNFFKSDEVLLNILNIKFISKLYKDKLFKDAESRDPERDQLFEDIDLEEK